MSAAALQPNTYRRAGPTLDLVLRGILIISPKHLSTNNEQRMTKHRRTSTNSVSESPAFAVSFCSRGTDAMPANTPATQRDGTWHLTAHTPHNAPRVTAHTTRPSRTYVPNPFPSPY
ncbi:hypothetical protein PAXINDRAFT_22400 [Paxillus involutus ATCC 200175]|uniref:Uncharacterized protein n=1 Tax=Paxillus involutus ATCC 200175 TaxID=664439 RepID=A0A0C9SLF1_PAXIN|nr:hypothetical protein PAXINDRAFT_22400 [Paxillus involutus ATCC 200175]